MSKTAYIFAALSLAIAAPALAAASGHLGQDISNAGVTKDAHLAFVGTLTKPDAYLLQKNCIKQLNVLTDREKTFCADIKQ